MRLPLTKSEQSRPQVYQYASACGDPPTMFLWLSRKLTVRGNESVYNFNQRKLNIL